MTANYESGETGGEGTVVEQPEAVLESSEAQDLKYLVENSCLSCDKVLPKYAVKIVPSSYMQERDEYVKKGIVARRLMCIDCYNNMKVSHRTRMRKSPLAQNSKSVLMKELINSFLLDH